MGALQTITGIIYGSDGAPVAGVPVFFQQVDEYGQPAYAVDAIDGSYHAPTVEERVTGPDGSFSIALWPTSRADRIVKYLVNVCGKYVTDTYMKPLPESASPIAWSDFISASNSSGVIITPPVVTEVAGYGSLAAAIATIGSAKATLSPSQDFSLDADVVIPSNIIFQPVNGAVIDLNGHTLTINGPFVAPATQVFTGSGTVTGLKEARPENFGATGTADEVGINKAIAAAKTVIFSKPFTIQTPINLASDRTLTFEGSGKITLDTGIINQYMVRGDAVSNVVIKDAVIEGNGLAGFSSVYLTSSSNIIFDHAKITKSGAIGINMDSCSDVSVLNSNLSSNYYYGIQDKIGSNNRFINNTFHQNGITGAATSTGGRGIVLWRAIGDLVQGNSFTENTEYGFRIYSEAADVSSSYGNRIIGNYFRENVVSDVVLYDESLTGALVLKNIIADNTVERTTNTSSGAVYILQGGKNTFINNHAYKTGAMSTDTAFNFYYAVDCMLSNSSATNFTSGLSFTGSSNVTADFFLGDGVANALTIPTTGIRVTNSRFIHGGVGVADVGIANYTSTGKNYYHSNYFEGFGTAIYIDVEPVSLMNNTTASSTAYGLRKTGSNATSQEFAGNSWDKAAPSYISDAYKTLSEQSRIRTTDTVVPSAGTWVKGSYVKNTNSTAGQPKGWYCSVTGTFSAATEAGTTTSGSPIITALADTSGFYPGDYVDASAGFAVLTALKILSKTSSTITVDRDANANGAATISTTDPTFVSEGNL